MAVSFRQCYVDLPECFGCFWLIAVLFSATVFASYSNVSDLISSHPFSRPDHFSVIAFLLHRTKLTKRYINGSIHSSTTTT